MRRLNAQISIVLLALIIVAVTAASMRYLGRYRPFADLTGDSGQSAMSHVGLSMTDAVVQGRAGGHKRWQIAANTITFSRDHRQVTVNGIRDGLLYDSGELPVVRLSAGRANYVNLGGGFTTGLGTSLQIDGGIQAEILARHGLILKSRQIDWDAYSHTLRSLGQVTAILPKSAGQAVGDDVQVDTRTGDFSLHHLHGRFRVPANYQ